jgi:single-strand DNA-binding protein
MRGGRKMNQVILVGRVAREVHLRKTSNGKPYLFLTIAVSGYWDRREKKEVTDFIPVTVWGKEAEKASHLVKGSLVRISGRISVGRFTDKEGQQRFTVDIIGEEVDFLSKPRSAVEVK